MNLVQVIWYIFVLSSLSVVDAKKSKPLHQSEDKALLKKSNERLQNIATKVLKHSQYIIPLSDRNFSDYIIDLPREYNALLMFTALAPKYQCSICMNIKDTFSKVATYYANQYNFNTTSIDKKLVFFMIDVDNSRNIFNDLALESVPRFFLIPPKDIHSTSKAKISTYEISTRLAIEGEQAFLTQIEEMSSIKISVTINSTPIVIVLCLVSILLAIFVSSHVSSGKNALLIYQNKYLWVIISLICMGAGVSGSIYCLLRSVPFFGVDHRSGKPQIFSAGQSREQYTLEGIIVALWTIGFGVSLYAMHYSTKIRFSIARHVGVILFLSTAITFLLQIWNAYLDKTKWYNLKETLPDVVWVYFSSTVKKSSGVFKRLLRLSEYMLFEYKDFNLLFKKFKLLVVDYIFRSFTTVSER